MILAELLFVSYLFWGIGFTMGNSLGESQGELMCQADLDRACEIKEESKQCPDECRGDK